MHYQGISVAQAQQLRDQRASNFIDIRDEQSYQQSHIKQAQHIDNHSLAEFLASTDKNQPLVVCCYHGNSSKSAAQFFAEQSFTEVYSLDGGFEAWHATYPEQCEAQPA